MEKGFTLIELMIVVAIISILALIFIPHVKDLAERIEAAQSEQSTGTSSEQRQTEIVNGCQLVCIDHPAEYNLRYCYDSVNDACFTSWKTADGGASSIAFNCQNLADSLKEKLMVNKAKCPLAKREPVAEVEEFGPVDE